MRTTVLWKMMEMGGNDIEDQGNDRPLIRPDRRSKAVLIDTKDEMIAEILKTVKNIDKKLDRDACDCSRSGNW